jgi:hypothetical protein
MVVQLNAGLRALRLGVLALLLIGPSTARGQTHDDSYELQRVRQYLDGAGLKADPAPEGKRVRRVVVVRREVFESDDLLVPVVLPRFASTWPNAFHHVTETSTILGEVLLREGEPFRTELAEESVRNLKGLPVIVLAHVVALDAGVPGEVDVLVYTRDLWSLRLETEFSGAGETFGLSAQLIERNFLGRNTTLGARFVLAPLTFSVGETYIDPRFLDQELRLVQSFDVLFNRDSGSAEGSVGQLRFGRPYYTLAQRFAFDVYASYSDFVSRGLRNGQVAGIDEDTGEVCEPGPEQCLRQVWDEWRMLFEIEASHRVGVAYKQTFTGGAGYSERSAEPNAETQLAPGQEEVFEEKVLPRARRDVYPYVRYRLALPRFSAFTNLGTFGLTEIVQLGPRLDASLAVPLRALGSLRDGFLARGLIGYTWARADMLVDVFAEGASSLDDGDVVDRTLLLQLRAASPSLAWLFGRLIARGIWEVRQNDTQNTLVTLGADNGLRGYPAQTLYATGASRVLCNFEYRTLPVVLQSIHVGLVAFYDVGSVYRSLPDAQFLHGAGGGVRVLLPQFNRDAFRLDVGVPLGQPGFSVLLSYGSDQVVPLTPAQDAMVPPSFPGRPASVNGTSLR